MSASESAGDLEERGMQGGRPEIQMRSGIEVHPHGERALEAFLTNWLTTRSAAGALQTSDRRILEQPMPLPIRLTLDQLLDLADETELRALTLEWMTRSFEVGVPSPRREDTLLQITAQLRRMAERLRAEDWREPA